MNEVLQFPALSKRMPYRDDHDAYTFPKGAACLGQPLPYKDGEEYVYGGKWNRKNLERYRDWSKKAEFTVLRILDNKRCRAWAETAVMAQRPNPNKTLLAVFLRGARPTPDEIVEIERLEGAMGEVRMLFLSTYGGMPPDRMTRKILADAAQVRLLADRGWLDAWTWEET